jgi:cell division protein ZapA (FtsZ GTPase activity inhibitor)
MSTADMIIEDKINLLAHLVPRFGSGDKKQEDALEAFASGLDPTFAVIRQKLPKLAESDVQLLGTELLCAEILIPGRSTKEEFAAWVGAMSDSELMGVLSSRKSFNTESTSELESFQEARAAEERRLENLRQKYQDQVEAARKSRTMAFNPVSGKFEEVKQNKDAAKK